MYYIYMQLVQIGNNVIVIVTALFKHIIVYYDQ